MTTSTDYRRRSGPLRRAGALVSVPRVAIAAILWLVLIEALPGPAARVVLAVLVGGLIGSVFAPPVIVRLVWWARSPSTPLAVPGHPDVHVLVTGRRASGIGQAGRGHLIVPTAWQAGADLPSRLLAARRRQLASAGPLELAYQWFTWPLQAIGSFICGMARGAARVPLMGFAWRARWVVAGIAVWQTIDGGQLAAVIGIVVVVGLTYLLPWTRTHHERLVLRSLADLGHPLTTPVVRRPAEVTVQASAAQMAHTNTRSREASPYTPCGLRRSAERPASCRSERPRVGPHSHRTTGRRGSRP